METRLYENHSSGHKGFKELPPLNVLVVLKIFMQGNSVSPSPKIDNVV